MHTKLVNLQIDLKSNMDRFIAHHHAQGNSLVGYLKSNMDRFIVSRADFTACIKKYLKSNMDRFIVVFYCVWNMVMKFKIQYG